MAGFHTGMAGCVAAHLLRRTHKVTIFERRANVGLTGNAVNVQGAMVDVPLRMMGTCYWTQLLDLVASAGVKTIHGRTDECLWTDDGIDFLQNQSWLVSLGWVAKHWIGNILPYWRLSRAVQRALRREGPSPTMTFGDWLVSQQISPSEICIAQLIRRLSWMLSCTYSQVCVCSHFGRRSPLRRNE